MFIFVSSCPQMQEAEPIRSMKAKYLEKILNISITFSVIILYNQKCFQKVLVELNTMTIKEVVLTIMPQQQVLSRTIQATRTYSRHRYIPYGSIHGYIWSHLIQALRNYFVIILPWSILQEITLLRVQCSVDPFLRFIFMAMVDIC